MRFKQPKLLDEKQTTVYKRAVDKNYNLKMKASRFIFSEISQKFPIMPFTARSATVILSYGCVFFMRNDYYVWLFILISSFPFFFMKKGFGREKGSLGVGWMCDPWSFAAVSCSSRETWCVCIYVVPCNKRVWTSSLIFFSNYGNNLFHL